MSRLLPLLLAALLVGCGSTWTPTLPPLPPPPPVTPDPVDPDPTPVDPVEPTEPVSSFEKIQPGWTRAQVEALVGVGFDTPENAHEPDSVSYEMADGSGRWVVVFDKHGPDQVVLRVRFAKRLAVPK